MLAEERKKYICDILNRKKAVRVAELSKQLGITEATVRKDLDELPSPWGSGPPGTSTSTH